MKIALTTSEKTLESNIDPRFGRCSNFIIIDTETMEYEFIENDSSVTGGAGIKAAQTVINAGAKAVITGNVGPNAFRTLSAGSVKIFVGVSGTIKEAVKRFKNGELEEIDTPNVGSHYGMKNEE
jgi:predicted Fe-Mo cluster-binding NifX family protein